MGLLPAESVPPMYVIEPSDYGSSCMRSLDNNNRFHIIGTKKEITISDIIDVYGERKPDYSNSQKSFKVQFALVVHEDSKLTQEDIDKFQEFIETFKSYFAEVTSNKANIEIVSVT